MAKEKVQKPVKDKTNKLKKVKRINFWNWQTTNPVLKLWICILRFAMIAFWIIAPILIAISYFYDDGLKYLTGYVYSSIFTGRSTTNGEVSFGDVVAKVELARKIITPLAWLLCTVIIGTAGLIPYFTHNTYLRRVAVAFNQMFWPVLFAAILWGIWFAADYFPSGTVSDINGIIYPKYQYWVAMHNTLLPYSGWMIIYQVVLSIWVIFGIFTAIEAHLIKKGKIDFSDFFVQKVISTSLVHQVVEGRLVFGENHIQDLKADMQQIKLEDRERSILLKQQNLEAANAKKQKKQKTKGVKKHGKVKKAA